MKKLTWNQKRVLNYLGRQKVPATVQEIAQAYYAPPSSIRSALSALQRYGVVEVKGWALTGGQTWGLVEQEVPF